VAVAQRWLLPTALMQGQEMIRLLHEFLNVEHEEVGWSEACGDVCGGRMSGCISDLTRLLGETLAVLRNAIS